MSNLMLPSLLSASLLTQPPLAGAFTPFAPWRGILAVEPDETVLHAKSVLLTKANYCVTQVSSDQQLFPLRETQAVPLAMLSDRLGPRLLGRVAETIRRQWPRMRILILGQVPRILDDYLYDEQICRASDSQQVLDELEGLYKGMWNRRSNSLDWRAARAVLCFAQPPIPHSYLANTTAATPPDDERLRERTSEIRLPATEHREQTEEHRTVGLPGGTHPSRAVH